MKHRESHIEDVKEWQEKQYLPGEYVSGKINPIFKQRTKGLAIGLLAIGIFFILFAGGFVFFDRTNDAIVNAVGYGFIGILFLAAGISVIKHLSTKPHESHPHK